MEESGPDDGEIVKEEEGQSREERRRTRSEEK
jgi:hypothetical protein